MCIYIYEVFFCCNVVNGPAELEAVWQPPPAQPWGGLLTTSEVPSAPQATAEDALASDKAEEAL